MNKLSLLVAAALLACGTLAQAEPTAPNPFARPTPASPAAAPAGQPAAGAPGAVSPTPPGATAPGAQPFPSAAPSQAMPGQNPGAMPPMPNGFTPGPGMPPASGVTGAPSMPGMPGAMPATTPGVETTEEEVSGQRIGTVNGVRIYRGQNTYMFESVKKRKIVRHLVPNTSPTTANLPPATTAQPANHKVPNLPSMVGRPNPQ